MMKFAVLLALVAYASAAVLPKVVQDDAQVAAELAALNPAGRIIGGTATTIDKVPYQVSLRYYGAHICGASIISEIWVLTAAHCVTTGTYNKYWVRTGTTYTNSGGSFTRFVEFTIHEDYHVNDYGVPVNDIAVLETLSLIVSGPNRRPIPLFQSGEEAPVGALAVISGWGYSEEIGYISSTLQTASIPIVSKSECSSTYAADGGLPAGQICAGLPDGGHDACQGDSGGPLAINGRLAGITSWGIGCGRPGLPGVYTEVAVFRDWIQAHTGI